MMIRRKTIKNRGEIYLAILFLVSIAFLSSPQTLSAQEERVAVVSSFDGEVKIQHGGVWKTVIKIGNRMKNSAIYSDDTVVTMPGTTAVLIFNDNTRLEVKADTTMTISEKQMVGEVVQQGYVTNVAGTPKKEIVRNIKIKAGGLWASVTPSKSVLTEFETPTGVASVRGTELSVDYDATTGIAAIDLGEGNIVYVSPGEDAVFDMGGGDVVHVAVPESGSGVALNVVSGDIEVNTPAGDVVNMNTGDGVEVSSSATGDTSVAVTATGDDGGVFVETAAGNLEMDAGDAVEVASTDSGEASVTVTATGDDGGVMLETSEGTLTIGDAGSLEVTVDSGTNEITVTETVGEVTITAEDGTTTDVGVGDGIGTVTTDANSVSGAIEDGANPGTQGTPAGDGNGGSSDTDGDGSGGTDPTYGTPTLNPNAPSGSGNNPNDLGSQNDDQNDEQNDEQNDSTGTVTHVMDGNDATELLNYYGIGGFAIPEKTSSVVIGNDLFTSVDISPGGYIHGSANGGSGEDGLEVSIVDNDNGDQGIMADDGFGISFNKGDSGALVTTFRDHDEDSADDEGPNIEQGGTQGTSFYSRATGNSVTANTSFDDLLISHEYRLDDLITDSHNVLVVDVTITNTSNETIRNLKYRKKADFDIDDTDWAVNPENEPIDRFVVPTIDPGDTPLIESVGAPLWGTVGNDPLGIDITNSNPGPYTEDNAALFQMDLGMLEPGQSITFPLFYSADNPTDHETDPLDNRTASENLQESIGGLGSRAYIEVSDPSNSNATFALGSGNDSNLYVPIDAENVDISSFNIISDTLSTMIGLLAETTYSSHAEVIADHTSATPILSATDIAVGELGDIYVTDNGSGSVLSVAPDGSVNTIASGLNDPTGIAVHSGEGETIYVTDNGTKEVLVMFEGVLGDLIPVSTLAGFDGDEGSNFTGIAIDNFGDVSRPIYVTDDGTDKVFRLFYGDGWAGEDVVTESNTGGRVDEPQAIAFSNDEDVMYVVENGFDAILRIDQLTGETDRIATERSSDWDINEPVDITVGGDGFLYFVDAGNNSVFKVNPLTGETKFLASADTTGGLLSNPTGIAIDSYGDIYVSSATNGIVRLLKTTNDKTLHAQALKLRADIVAHDQEFSDPANEGIITALDGVIAKLQNNVDVGPVGDDGLSNDGIQNVALYIPATELFNDLETIRNNFIAQAGFPDSLVSHTTVTHLLLDALKLAGDSVSLHLDEIEANLNKAEAYLTAHSNSGGDSADGDLVELFSPILSDITILRDGDSTDEATDSDVRQGIESLLTDLVDHVSPNNNPFHSLQPFTNTDAVNMMFDNGVGGAFDPGLTLNTRNVIDNGTLTAGVSSDGSLIEEGTGLRMKGFSNSGENGGDVLAGDGYGVSYRTLDDQGLADGDFVAMVGSGGGADPLTHGTTIYTKHNKSRMETFTSQVGAEVGEVFDYDNKGDLAITHQFKLLPQADNAPEGDSRENIMSVEVTLTNTGDNTITNLLYRRLADIDSGSTDTAYDSLFTVNDDGNSSDSYGIGAPSFDGTSSDPDPPSLDPTTGFGNSFPSTYAGNLETLIQFDLDTLAPGESETFEFFYAGDNSTDDLSNTIVETVTDARYVSSTSNDVDLDIYPTFALGTGTEIASFDTADVASREASYFNIFTDTMTLMIQNMAKAEYVALTVADFDSTTGKIRDPSDIAIAGNGDLLVTNDATGTIYDGVLRIDPVSGDVIEVIASEASTGGDLDEPTGIVIADNGDLFVSDFGSDTVLRIDPVTGATTVIISEDLENPDPANIDNPKAVAIDNNGDLIVADWSSEKILRLHETSPDVWTTTVITSQGISNNLIEDPTGVVVDSKGNIILTDDDRDLVLRVDPVTGEVTTIASEFITAKGEEIIDDPQGIAIDSNGLFLITDDSDTQDAILVTDPVTGDTRYVATNTSTDGKIVDPKGLAIDDDGSIFFVNNGDDSVGIQGSVVKLVETTSTESLLALAEKIRADIAAHNTMYSVSVIDDIANLSFFADIDGVISDIESNLSNQDSPGIWVSRQDIFDSLRTTRDLLAEHADMQEPVEHASIAHVLLDSKRLADDNVRLNLAAINTEIGMAQDFMVNHIINSNSTTVHRYIKSQIDSIASNIDTLQADIYDINTAALIQNGVGGAFLDVIDHMLFVDQERSHSHNELVHNPFEPHQPNGERDGDVMSASEGLELMNHYGVGGYSIPENPNSIVIGNDFFTHIDISPEGRVHGEDDGEWGFVPSIFNDGNNEDNEGIIDDDAYELSFNKTGNSSDFVVAFAGDSDTVREVGAKKGTAFYSRSTGTSVTANTTFDDLLISHDYKITDNEVDGYNVLIANVTITNTGGKTITDLLYRKAVDFDLFSSGDDVFEVPSIDPGDELIEIVAAPHPWEVEQAPFDGTIGSTTQGTYTGDQAAVVQLDLGSLGPYESITFPVFFAGDDSSDNLQASIDRVVSTTYIEVYDPDIANNVYALGSGTLNLETPTDVSPEGKEHMQLITDAMSLMIGHLAGTSYSSHARTLASHDSTGDVIEAPYDMDIDSNGDLIVADPVGKVYRVNSVTGDLDVIFNWQDLGEWVDPQDVVIDINGDLIIADNSADAIRRIKKDVSSPTGYESTAHIIADLSSAGLDPEGIAIDPDGNIIINDHWNEVILKLEKNVSSQTGYATTSTVLIDTATLYDHELYVLDIAIDSNGDLIVTDGWGLDPVLRRIDPVTGEILTIATDNSTGGDISNSRSLAIDEKGFIYVQDLSSSIFKVHPLTGKTKFIASGETTLINGTPIIGGVGLDDSFEIGDDGTIFIGNEGNKNIVALPKTTNDKRLLAFAEKLRADILTHDGEFPDSEHTGILSDLNTIILKIDANVTSANTYSSTEIFGDLESARSDFIAHAGLADVFSHLDVSHLLLDAFKMAHDSVPLYIDEIDAVVSKAKDYLVNYNFDYESGNEHDGFLTDINSIISDIGVVNSNIRDLDTAREVKGELRGLLTDLVNHISPGNNPFKFLQPFTNNDAVQMMADNGIGGAFIPSLAINTENVIDNGQLTVGISREGSLRGTFGQSLPGDQSVPGLKMDGFDNNGVRDGNVIPHEGYGVSYDVTTNNVTKNYVAMVGEGFSGADSSTYGTTIYTKGNSYRRETFTSQVGVDRIDSSLKGDLNITHQFKLIPDPFESPEGYSREKVLSVEVTVNNTGIIPITGLTYRRVAAFDIGNPDISDDSEFTVPDITNPSIVSGNATLDKVGAPPWWNAVDDVIGFSYDPETEILNDSPGTYEGDHVAKIQFGIGTLEPGESKTFEFFYAGDTSSDDLQDTINEAVRDARYVSSTSNTVDPYQTVALGTGSSINSFDSAYVAPTEASHFNMLTDTLSLMIRNLAKTEYVAKTVADFTVSDGGGSEPYGIAIESDGDLVVADLGLSKVVRIEKDETFSSGWQDTATVIASSGTTNLIDSPIGIAVDTDGDLIVTDKAKRNISRIDPVTGVTTVIANSSSSGAAAINWPTGVAVDSNDDLIVTDSGSFSAYRVDPVTGQKDVILNYWSSGGLIAFPQDIAIDSNGDLIIADTFQGGKILKVDPSNGSASTLVTKSSSNFKMSGPVGIAIDDAGLLVVSGDGSSGSVLKVDPVSGDVKVIATASSTDNKIDTPWGVAIDSDNDGSILLSDTGNGSIVKLEETTSTNYLLAFARKIRGDMEEHDDEHTDENDATVRTDHEDFLADIDIAIAHIETNIGDPNSVNKTIISGKIKDAWEGLVDHADMQEPAQHAAIAHTLLDSKRLADDQVRLNLASIEEGILLAKAFMDDHINDFGDTTVHRDIDSQINSALGKVSTLKNNIYDTSAAASIKSEVQEAFCDVIDHTIHSDTMEGANPFHFCHGNMDEVVIP